MSSSYTVTESVEFTITHARYLASKVATDLKRLQRFYGSPSNYMIEVCEEEIIELLKYGYLYKVTYGFMRNERLIVPTVIYHAKDIGYANSDDPGKVWPRADISGASFYSYLEYSEKWRLLSKIDQESFMKSLRINRDSAPEPEIEGYVVDDRIYTSGGKSLSRSSIRSF